MKKAVFLCRLRYFKYINIILILCIGLTSEIKMCIFVFGNFTILCILGTLYFTNQASIFQDISSSREFFKVRRKFVESEKRRQLGGNIRLSPKEREVNEILMKFKRSEIDNAISTGKPFPPSVHFFEAKRLIDNSNVFQIIRKMPKGGLLHVHDIGLTDLNWLVNNVTYRDNPLYICRNGKNELFYQYFVDNSPPSNPDCPWRLLRQERAVATDAEAFDASIFNSLSLVVDNPLEAFPTTDSVWDELTNMITRTGSLIALKSVFEDYFLEGLKGFLVDNIQYVELRANLIQVIDRNGRILNETEVLQLYKDVADHFIKENPQFYGVKIIFAGIKTFNNERVLQDVKKSIGFLKKFPKFFAGYDLIFNEDRSPPISNVVDALLYPRTLNPPVDLPYFLHAGETNWQGQTADNNIFDAVVLNTRRLGHGFTLVKHPLVKHVMRRCNKAVEMNPISHQALRLIEDQRDHPASTLIAEGFPLVIGSDASPMWNALPLSHDYYIVFMGYTGKDDDIKVLKTLFLNSLNYSSLDRREQKQVLKIWNRKWDEFLDEIIESYRGRKLYG